MFPGILHNFELFVQGQGFLGDCTSCKPANLVTKKDTHLGGGMSGEEEIIFAAHEALKAEFKFISLRREHYQTFGLSPFRETTFHFRARVSRQDGNGFEEHVYYMRGSADLEFEDMKVGALSGVTMPVSVTFLHITQGDETRLKLEPRKGIWIVNGVDQLRSAARGAGQ